MDADRMLTRRGAVLGMIGAAAVPGAALAQGLFINPLEERVIGVKSHPRMIEQEGGLYGNRALSSYVTEIGMRLARSMARYPEQFVFTVVNNPIPNASNGLGGFVYMNAGYLPWFNDEAEMASTLGHEVGHAIRRHVAHQANRASIGDRLTRLRALRRPEEYEEMKIRANLAIKTFSRESESESDTIAVNALAKLGYDPFAMPTKLYNNLLRDRLFVADQMPEALRTHPFTSDRIRATTAEAKKFAPVSGSGIRNRDRYLDMINGLPMGKWSLYGPAPVRVRVVPVTPGATIASLSARMPSPVKRRLFMALNGLDDEAGLQGLTRVKTLV